MSNISPMGTPYRIGMNAPKLDELVAETLARGTDLDEYQIYFLHQVRRNIASHIRLQRTKPFELNYKVHQLVLRLVGPGLAAAERP